jgi:UDP-N-acetylmuramyl pentapeptide phosphotransferase/UDP-N-acetylglucosamine-1-phosphate transferase
MNLILPIFLSLFTLFLINNFIKKNKNFFLFFSDSDFKKPQSFHKEPILRMGGFFLIIPVLIYAVFNLNNIFFLVIALFSLTNFLLGLIDDAKLIRNPFLRFFLFLSFNFFLIFFFKIKINNFDLYFFDYINTAEFFSYFLVLFSIFFIVNGSNLIDGFNGLLAIHALIISYILLFICFYFNLKDELDYILIILTGLNFFLLLNFPKARFFLGDNGSFFIGSFLSFITIMISNLSKAISPFFYAIILYYIFFEILFSVFRKIFEKKNPFYPDKYHLHMLIFYFLKKKNNLLKSNYLTSIFINIVYLITLIPVIYFYNNTFACKIYLLALFSLYLFFYFFFRKKCKI